MLAISDSILGNDALKNNVKDGDQLNETWSKLLNSLKFYEDIDDHTMYLRERWVSGSAEWMGGKYGSKQNDKHTFGYSDEEWNYIWATMMEDGSWAVPSIKDSEGNEIKPNLAPEMFIKYIAHDLQCHIIVFDLHLNIIQFCSANHLKDDNVAFDSPLLLYSTGGHFQSVFQTDHEYFIDFANKLENENSSPPHSLTNQQQNNKEVKTK